MPSFSPSAVQDRHTHQVAHDLPSSSVSSFGPFPDHFRLVVVPADSRVSVTRSESEFTPLKSLHHLRHDCSREPAEIYRAIWRGGWGTSTSTLLYRKQGSYYVLGSGRGGHRIDFDRPTGKPIRLTAARVRDLAALLDASQFWRTSGPRPETNLGLDGAVWIFQGLVDGQYHDVERWEPTPESDDAPFGTLLAWLFHAAGVAVREVWGPFHGRGA